jgi:Predicted rRNA methylase
MTPLTERASGSHSGDRARAPRRPFSAPAEEAPVFGILTKDVRDLLESFPEIVQSVFPLDSKKLQMLPEQIRDLSHELTDERSDRRVGYLNEPPVLSAYIRYYMWWNLVRLTRLCVSLPLSLEDGDAAVDLGSGPLTLPIALWMARPELRKKKLTWYCVDISQGALSAGEDLFLSLAAKTGDEPWEIVRLKGELGVSLRRKVSLVTSANMFNELFWDNPMPLEAQVKHHTGILASYAGANASILVVEPGVPRAGRFISLLRDSLMRIGFNVLAPCPHEQLCPFPGLRYGKWCHFVFDTSDAPQKLHKLSEEAGLSKDRAALSFVFARREEIKTEILESDVLDHNALSPGKALESSLLSGAVTNDTVASLPKTVLKEPSVEPLEMLSRMTGLFPGLKVRITSDPIKLPDYYTGRYGCSELGMVLVTGTYQAADYLKTCQSGSLIVVPRPDRKKPERDPKTDALIIKLK